MFPTDITESALTSALLDTALRRINDGDVFDAMEELLIGLDAVRRSTRPGDWRSVHVEQVRRHALVPVVHRAPFTHRAFSKPRGYPGDAVTLDYIYGVQPLGAGIADAVADLYAWEFQTPSCRSVRARKALLAIEIDEAGRRAPNPRILSLACGHLREAREATLLLDRRAGAFFAVDQDPESLAVVAGLKSYGVEPVRGSVRGVLTGRITYRELDLAYAAGLYDYLADAVATQLTARLFAMLRSGGRLLVPNFNLSLRDIGYLEAFMDWWLLYRNDEDMIRLLAAVPEREVADARLFRDRDGNITFLEVTRR